MEKSAASEVLEIIEKNFRKNRDNRIKEFNKDMNKKYDLDYSDELVKEEQKINVEPKKIKNRKFKIIVLRLSIMSLAVVGTVGVISKKLSLSETEKFIEQMTQEAEIHGGKKNTIDDKYIYDLEAHSESGDCLIEGDGFARNRIIDTCVEHELSEEVTKSIVDKFDLNYNNNYKDAEKIDPLKIYQEEQKELKQQDNSYTM